MNFQTLSHIETAEEYIDQLFRAGQDAGTNARAPSEEKKSKYVTITRLMKSRAIEAAKVRAVAKTGMRILDHIVESYPRLDTLDPFYRALVECTLDYGFLKKCLGSLAWGQDMLKNIEQKTVQNIRVTRDIPMINKHRRAFYGRAASIFKQLQKFLAYLEEGRKVMKKFPAIKTSVPTVVIAGAPNVGKSSILSAVTGSTPKIASYPFTTQNLMVGYLEKEKTKIQLIDTPGLLDRPIHERNPIEKQALLALKHLAKLILFVLDPSESCGYSFQEQLHLLRELRTMFSIPVLVVANKTDLAFDKKLAEETLLVSVEKKQGIEELKERILKEVNV